MRQTVVVWMMGMASLVAGCEAEEIIIDDVLDDIKVILNEDDDDCRTDGHCDGDVDTDIDADADADADTDTDADTDSIDNPFEAVPDANGWVDETTNIANVQGPWWSATDVESGGHSGMTMTIVPGEGVCVAGEASQVIDEDWSTHWGALIGLSLCVNDADETPPGSEYTIGDCPRATVATLFGFHATIENWAGSEIRVGFKEAGRDEFVYIPTFGNTQSEGFMFEDATIAYDPGAAPLEAQDIESIVFHVPTNPMGPTEIGFCVYDLEPMFPFDPI